MALRDRLVRPGPGSDRGAARGAAQPEAQPKKEPTSRTTARPRHVDEHQELKQKIHRQLIDKLDVANLDSFDKDQLVAEFRPVIEALIAEEGVPLGNLDKERIVKEILNEIFGLGPLEVLLDDPSISEILVNRCDQIYVEQRGKLTLSDVRFKDEGHLMQIIERIVSRVGRRIDESQPICDARLLDGSRVNCIIPPLALDGASISIRRFGAKALTISDLINFGALTPVMAEILEGCVKARMNILISGGTGSGKTTLLNALSNFIPPGERIVTIEDSAELQLQQDHVVRLETRPPNIEGKGEVTQRDLIKNCLRMRPDRIVVGEVRSGEALDMLQAMNTGHDGSISTLHANNPREAITRLETMIAMAGVNIPNKALRSQIASAVDMIIQASRLSDGSRKILYLSEVVGMEGETITMQDVFIYDREGVSPDGKVVGKHRPTGIRPKFMEKFRVSGIEISEGVFGQEE